MIGLAQCQYMDALQPMEVLPANGRITSHQFVEANFNFLILVQ